MLPGEATPRDEPVAKQQVLSPRSAYPRKSQSHQHVSHPQAEDSLLQALPQKPRGLFLYTVGLSTPDWFHHWSSIGRTLHLRPVLSQPPESNVAPARKAMELQLVPTSQPYESRRASVAHSFSAAFRAHPTELRPVANRCLHLLEQPPHPLTHHHEPEHPEMSCNIHREVHHLLHGIRNTSP